ncbi:ATP-dependent RNA helicase DHX33-like [Amphiura filiformis]|uniref:ATP-dependent RNA helicase DHX33-like n=1 Tax=Amphiura filiformis TaxID=82378 RepID=UPI003B20C771
MEGNSAKRQKSFHSNNHSSNQSDDLYHHRCNLPIYPARGKLLSEIHKTQCSIVIGETGSGKTTQIPQYLLEAGFAKNGIIACTQPRRVAAVTIADRVAQEKNAELGQEVGYCVRFEDMTSSSTKIKYMTDGMLLREAILDPLLRRYSVIVLDEAHERTIHTDVLFGVVKSAQKHRNAKSLVAKLKIIVMSATMDVDHFSRYFNNAPVLYLQGRQHPIQLMYSGETQNDYLFAAMVAIFQIHQEQPANEDILVFLTGQEEIEAMVRSVKDIARDCPSGTPPLVVTPLYAALAQGAQLKVFQPTPRGKRKLILSTNIAETSVTIPGIKHVIDTGRVKAKSYVPGSGLDMLKVQWTSQSQACQRMGRAGREASGTCWRLYTETEFSKLPTNTIPEIQRSNLSSVVLQLMALGIKDVVHFDFMDPPSEESLESAVKQLQLLGAIGGTGKAQLTTLGRDMSAFPLEPRLAKVILAANKYQCVEEILTIVSLLSVESVLHSPHTRREEAHAAWRKFSSSEGDHVMLLSVYRAFKAVKGNKQWCFENFVHVRNMRQAVEVRQQLRTLCVRQHIPLKSCGQDTTSIRKCLVQGLFMNSAELQRDGTYLTLDRKQTVTIHPSSCLFNCKPAYLLYNELVQTTKCYMRNVCLIDPEWLYEVAPEYFRQRVARKK